MKKLLAFSLLLLAAAPAVAQAPATRDVWMPKPATLAPFAAPNRPVWHLADVLKAHAGQTSWSQMVMREANGLTGTYIQSAPGDISKRVFYSDSTVFFVVQSGQYRVRIDGITPFIATKGFVVQVPSVRFFTVEAMGDTPALRFEVTQTQAAPYYAESETTEPLPGIKYERSGYFTGTAPYGKAKPFIDFQQDIVQGGASGVGIVRDDYIAADIQRGTASAAAGGKGDLNVRNGRLWFVMEGQVNGRIEGAPGFTAADGDVVYAPAGRFYQVTPSGAGVAATITARPAHESLDGTDTGR